MRRLDLHILLSALWLFMLLNIIFRDIHQFVLASHIEMLLTGHYNGVEFAALIAIVWTAWMWPVHEPTAPHFHASSS